MRGSDRNLVDGPRMIKEDEEPIELTTDDDAFFAITGQLIEELGRTKDHRIAELVEKAIELCRQDENLVTKLLLKTAAKAQQTAPEAYNPFARAYR